MATAMPMILIAYRHGLRASELCDLQWSQVELSHVFLTERDGPMTPKAFYALLSRIGARTKMPFPIHPHMLRHGCGYALANAGHELLDISAVFHGMRH